MSLPCKFTSPKFFLLQTPLSQRTFPTSLLDSNRCLTLSYMLRDSPKTQQRYRSSSSRRSWAGSTNALGLPRLVLRPFYSSCTSRPPAHTPGVWHHNCSALLLQSSATFHVLKDFFVFFFFLFRRQFATVRGERKPQGFRTASSRNEAFRQWRSPPPAEEVSRAGGSSFTQLWKFRSLIECSETRLRLWRISFQHC